MEKTYKYEVKPEVYEPHVLSFHELCNYIRSLNTVGTDFPLSVNGKKVVDVKFNRKNNNIELITEI